MEKINFNGAFPNLSRAYEIAKFGNFSITVFYSADTLDYPKADEDYQLLKEFYNDVEFKSEGNIFVQIIKPRDYKSFEHCETIEDIHKRVEKAKSNQIPMKYDNNSACYELLKNATQRLNFSSQDVEIIDRMALKIAQLDSTKEIEAHHIAEAIQYRIKDNYQYPLITAEDNTIEFGDSIKIKRGDIESEYVEQAIDYLKTL
jgi:disulfide oxidoreductase YuzD